MLWWMAIKSPSEETFTRWYVTLDEGEKARADRFGFSVDRETYVAAHALTRGLLTHVDGLAAAAWRFSTTPTGRPEIAPSLGRPRLRFSLSHTRGLVACAVGLDLDLGVDVEADRDLGNELDLASKFFAPDELSLLRQIPEKQRRKTFLRIWTLKEAYIKATGQGLSCPLDSFAFGLDPITIRFHADATESPSRWQFIQFDPTPKHVIALAAFYARSGPLGLITRALASDGV